MITRVCACGCGQSFKVPEHRPGRRFRYGHKPTENPAPILAARVHLDYQLARKKAEQEKAELERAIDTVDDEILGYRGAIRVLEDKKEADTRRHEMIVNLIQTLDQLIDEARSEQAA